MSVRRIDLHAGSHVAAVEVTGDGSQALARVGDQEVALTIEQLDDGVFVVTSGAKRRMVHYAAAGGRHLFQIAGDYFAFEFGRGVDRRRTPGHHHDLAAPMPGVVARIFVEEGQAVQAGDPLFAVEAMKMENLVRTPSAGRVTRLALSRGAQVDAGAIVVEVQEEPAP